MDFIVSEFINLMKEVFQRAGFGKGNLAAGN